MSFPTAAQAGYHMPAEWEPHERCWMAWPCREGFWVDLEATQVAYANVANAIAGFEPVTMLATREGSEAARRLCGDSVTILEAELDDSWTRDSGPNFVVNREGSLAASIFQFNAWGQKYTTYRQDAALGHRLAEHLGIPTFTSSLFMEGGGINVDGQGTLLTTEQCVLHPNRNPGLTREEAEVAFQEALGIRKVIWLPGDPMDTETDGHVDGIACFVRPGVVLVEVSPEPGTEWFEISQANLEAVMGQTDASGRPLEIVQINDGHEAERRTEIFCSSYINFYIANGGIVMPGFGIPRDAEAKARLEQLFPDRAVVQVDINDIAVGGGGIHCITQQQPVT